jgi:hypothetical protein
LKKVAAIIGLGVAALALGVSGPVRESHACGNEVEHEIDFSTSLVAQAERTTNAGRHADALKQLASMFPEGRARPGDVGDRAQLVAARAIARTGGRYGLNGALVQKEGGELSNLHLAGRFVHERLLKKPDDPSLRTDYAEVLAQIPEKQLEARKILVELEKKDLVTSAYGYAALARLRSTPRKKDLPSWLDAPLQTLDRAPRVIDLARCERMATGQGICTHDAKTDAPAATAKTPGPALTYKPPKAQPAPPAKK